MGDIFRQSFFLQREIVWRHEFIYSKLSVWKERRKWEERRCMASTNELNQVRKFLEMIFGAEIDLYNCDSYEKILEELIYDQKITCIWS